MTTILTGQPAVAGRPNETLGSKASGILAAAVRLLSVLEAGKSLDARILREAMLSAFKANDADGVWIWKDAYEAAEAAAVLFLRKYAQAMRAKAATPAKYLAMIERLSTLLPSHTRRSEESDQFQQFSTPLGLAFLMSHAAQIAAGEAVLEPLAGTGLLAIQAEAAGAALILNELAETRRAMLSGLFPAASVTGFNAEHIDDFLSPSLAPAIALMNPPFSASPFVERAMRDAAAKPIRSALRRLPEGGRLVVLTGANQKPCSEDLADKGVSFFPRPLPARSTRGTALRSIRG